MSLLAEEIVEEWLNRKAYFTVRGLKQGVAEIDLLAIKNSNHTIDALHVEVQVSFRPVTYISPLTKELVKATGKNPRSALLRTSDLLESCVNAWIENKFASKQKQAMRNSLWSGLTWNYCLAHGAVKCQDELKLIESKGIRLINLREVMENLVGSAEGTHSTTGADIVELIRYYGKECD